MRWWGPPPAPAWASSCIPGSFLPWDLVSAGEDLPGKAAPGEERGVTAPLKRHPDVVTPLPLVPEGRALTCGREQRVFLAPTRRAVKVSPGRACETLCK